MAALISLSSFTRLANTVNFPSTTGFHRRCIAEDSKRSLIVSPGDDHESGEQSGDQSRSGLSQTPYINQNLRPSWNIRPESATRIAAVSPWIDSRIAQTPSVRFQAIHSRVSIYPKWLVNSFKSGTLLFTRVWKMSRSSIYITSISVPLAFYQA